jgi:hypothetical protein
MTKADRAADLARRAQDASLAEGQQLADEADRLLRPRPRLSLRYAAPILRN